MPYTSPTDSDNPFFLKTTILNPCLILGMPEDRLVHGFREHDLNIHRHRIYMISALGVMVLLGIIYGTVSRTMLDSMEGTNEEVALHNADRIIRLVESEQRHLAHLASDWANWDAMFAFAESPSPPFIDQYLQQSAFDLLDISLLAIWDLDGELIVARQVDRETQKPLPLPDEMDVLTRWVRSLLGNGMPPAPVKGYLPINGRPCLIALQPILTSRSEGPSPGVLLFGRIWNDQDMSQVFNLLDMVTSSDIHPVEPLSEEVPARPAQASARFVNDVQESQSVFYDLLGRPAWTVTATRANPYYAHHLNSLRQLLLVLLAVGFVFCGLLFILLNRNLFLRRRQDESEYYFRTFFNKAAVGMAIADANGYLIETNATMHTQLGYSASQLARKRLSDLTPADGREAVDHQFKLLETSPSLHVIFVSDYQHADQSMLSGQTTVAILRDPHGNTQRFLITLKDISDRIQAKRKVEVTSRALRALVEGINDLIAVPDLDGLYRMTVEMAREHIGLTRASLYILQSDRLHGSFSTSLAGKTLDTRNLILPADAPLSRLIHERTSSQQKTRLVDMDWTEWDGFSEQKVGTGWVAITPILTSTGPYGLFCYDDAPRGAPPDETQMDLVTLFCTVLGSLVELKQTELRLQRMALAVEQAAESILITDARGNIEYANPAFTQITGYKASEVIGKSTRILKSGVHDEAFYEKFWATLLAGNTWQGRITNRRKDGHHYDAYQVISPLRDRSNKVINYVSGSRDITRELQLEDQFIQAQKMEGIGRLAGGIAHDFNNLLTVILGNSKLLLEMVPDGDPIRNEIDEVVQAGERAAKLTRQLLTFARKQMVELRPVRLNVVAQEMTQLLRRTVGEHIKIVTDFEPLLGFIQADAGLMEQILVNLAVNSRDAMPEGGTLTIRTRNVRMDEINPRVHIEDTYGNLVLLQVEDTGTGMDTEVQEHIFEPFYTTKDKGKGTGLGLATVYGIAQQCEAHIELFTERGEGTRFNFYFPRIETPDREEIEEEIVGLPGGHETILVVEDQEAVRNLAARILESLGYSVLQAHDGREGLDLFSSLTESIDLILTDIVMPRLNGPEMVKQAQLIKHDIPVVYMSGFTEGALGDYGLTDKHFTLIAKPFSREELVLKIRQQLDHQKPATAP